VLTYKQAKAIEAIEQCFPGVLFVPQYFANATGEFSKPNFKPC